MKRSLPVVLAILLIAAMIMLVLAWREIGSLREELAIIKKERATFATPANAKPPSAPKPVVSAKEPVVVAEPDKKPEGGVDLLMGAGKEEVRRRSDARLALLRDRLKLSPAQMAALEKAAATRIDSVLAAFERMKNNTARPPDFGVVMDWTAGRVELPVAELLDADQAALFADFDHGERASRIENLVGIEMMEINSQGALNLTPEQKDQVFARLSEINTSEEALGAAYYTDDAAFNARIAESLRLRREALAPILDAAQAAQYERMLEDDRVLIEKTFQPEGGPK